MPLACLVGLWFDSASDAASRPGRLVDSVEVVCRNEIRGNLGEPPHHLGLRDALAREIAAHGNARDAEPLCELKR